MKTVHIFTDGSCRGNPGPGGWARTNHNCVLRLLAAASPHRLTPDGVCGHAGHPENTASMPSLSRRLPPGWEGGGGDFVG